METTEKQIVKDQKNCTREKKASSRLVFQRPASTYEDFLEAVQKQREHGIAFTLKSMKNFFHKDEKNMVEKKFHCFMKETDLAFELLRSNFIDISFESFLCIMQSVKILSVDLTNFTRK